MLTKLVQLNVKYKRFVHSWIRNVVCSMSKVEHVFTKISYETFVTLICTSKSAFPKNVQAVSNRKNIMGAFVV